MSASDKKKLRKEQNATALTEKQLLARKEAKKLKTYTLTFVLAMVLVIAIVVGVIVTPLIAGVIHRNTHAVTIGNRELSTADLSYYYVDAISAFYSDFKNTYGDYAEVYAEFLGSVMPKIPLNKQPYKEEEGKTWADYFIEEAKTNAKWTFALYDEAIANGFKISEDSQKFLDNFESNMKMYATMYGFSSLDGYLRSTYGDGADLESYQRYYTYSTYANEYSTHYHDSIEFKNEDYRTFEQGDKFKEYNSYSYASYYVKSNDYLTFLKLGTVSKDDAGKETTTYSDEDKAKALAAAKKDAEAMGIADNNTVEKLNAALAALDINKDKKDDQKPTFTETEFALYSALSSNEELQKWLSSADRKTGDITVIESKTTDSDNKETVTGYHVILFLDMDENQRKLADVRHMLVKFTGGKTENGATVYSDEEKAAAKKKAEDLLAEYNKTKMTDADFEKLAKEKSEDTGTKANGGLIEGINRDSSYVDSFLEWSLAEHKVGDTGIIESEYGYHVMYYKGDQELSYRDSMIDAVMTQEAYDKWEDGLTEKIKDTDVNLSGINVKYTIAG